MLEIWSEEKFQKVQWEFFSPNMKNVLLSKYEDKWPQPHAVVLHTTCSDSYLSFWPASLDRLQCIVHMGRGEWGRRRRTGLTSSITAQTARQPFETQ